MTGRRAACAALAYAACASALVFPTRRVATPRSTRNRRPSIDWDTIDAPATAGAEDEPEPAEVPSRRGIVAFAAPVAALNLANFAMGSVDTAAVGTFGTTTQLAALAPGTMGMEYSCYSLSFLTTASLNLLSTITDPEEEDRAAPASATARCSRRRRGARAGAGRDEAAGREQERVAAPPRMPRGSSTGRVAAPPRTPRPQGRSRSEGRVAAPPQRPAKPAGRPTTPDDAGDEWDATLADALRVAVVVGLVHGTLLLTCAAPLASLLGASREHGAPSGTRRDRVRLG